MDILLGINLVLSDMTMVGFEAPMSNMLDPGRPGPHDGRLSGYVVPRLALLSIVHGNEVTFVCAVNLMAHGGRDAAATYATIMRLCLTSFSLALAFSVTVTALLAYPIYTHTKAFAEALGQRQVAVPLDDPHARRVRSHHRRRAGRQRHRVRDPIPHGAQHLGAHRASPVHRPVPHHRSRGSWALLRPAEHDRCYNDAKGRQTCEGA